MVLFIYSKDISWERRSLQKSEVRAEHREGTRAVDVRDDYPTWKACEPESAEMARIELREEAEIRSCSRQREQHMQRFENIHKYCEWEQHMELVWPTFGWGVGEDRGLRCQAEQLGFT